MKEQFQIHSLNIEPPAKLQLLYSTTVDKESEVMEVVVVQLYYCPFLRSSVDRYTMPSNSSEIAVAPGFYSFCNDVQKE